MNYPYLYRVLRPTETTVNGIHAKNPWAKFKVKEHVANGRLSTTASSSKAVEFASKDPNYQPGNKRIAQINTERLQNVQYIDLTNPSVLYSEIPDDERAQNFARHFEEVLIVGDIPADCIYKIHVI